MASPKKSRVFYRFKFCLKRPTALRRLLTAGCKLAGGRPWAQLKPFEQRYEIGGCASNWAVSSAVRACAPA